MSDFKNRISQLTPKQLILLADSLNSRLEAAGRVASEPLAVVGLGCRFPGGANTPGLLWDLLVNGREGILEVPRDRWDIDAYLDSDPDRPGKMNTRWGGFLDPIDQFDADFFGISPREAATMDPQQRLLLEVAWETLEYAGINPRDLSGSSTGVYAGICNNDYFHMLVREGVANIDTYMATGTAHSIASGRISYILGLQGPSLSIDTACSSSLVAVHLACQSLRLGECRLALAGGVNLILSPEVSVALSKAHMMAPDGRCKAFDRAADGFVRGEGCGMVALKRLSDARADGDAIIALILGSAVNQDGRSGGITAPNGPSQEAVIRKALLNANLDPSAIDYVEAHGTGTSLGDPIEMGALAGVFGSDRDRSNPLLVGSVKTNLGHAESAAGIAGLIKLILSVNKGEVPPHLHFQEPNPKIDWSRLAVRIPVAREPWPESTNGRIGAVSSFGFSGTNAHVIVGEAPPSGIAQVEEGEKCHLVAISARNESALCELAGRYADYLENHPETVPVTFCRTIAEGRTHHLQRAAFHARTLAEISRGLDDIRRSKAPEAILRGRPTSKRALQPVFLFTGQGSQYPGMGMDLYENQPAFRRALDECDKILSALIGIRIRDLMDPSSSSVSLLDQTGYTQPVLFALEYALATMWRDWGVEPAAVMGHSVGEYVAACIAGLFGLEDGLRLIVKRGRLMQELPDLGGMAAVFAPAGEVKAFVVETEGAVSIAAVNGPGQTVISGEREPLADVLQALDGRGIPNQALRVSHAFHSRLMEPMLEALAAEASRVRFATPRLPIVSNLTGAFAEADSMANPDYWQKHTRSAVQFASGLQTLGAAGHRHFLEIGPHPVLSALGRQCLTDSTVKWHSSLQRGRSDQEEVLHSLGALYVEGADVHWARLEGPDGGAKIPLPSYPFQRKRYWFATTGHRPTESSISGIPDDEPGSGTHPLLGMRLSSPALSDTVFESQIALNRLTFLSHHRVFGLWIMPTPAYVEMAMAAAERVGISASMNGATCEISDLCIESALILSEEKPIKAQTIVTLTDPNHGECRFFGADQSAGGIEWLRHATCRIQTSAAETPARTSRELKAARSRCTDEIPVDTFYRDLQDLGLTFGSAFRGITRIWQGDHEALGEMALQDELVQDAGRYTFHPALLDACFHLIGAATGRDMSEDAYLLIGIERFRLLKTPPSRFWNWTRVERNGKPRSESISGDIVLFDDEGRIIAEITNLLLRRVDRNSLVAPAQKGQSSELLYSVRWHQQPRPTVGPTTTGATLDPTGAAARLTEKLRDYGKTFGLGIYESLQSHLDGFCTAAIIRAFRDGGADFEPGHYLTRDNLERQMGIVPRYRRLLTRLLNILAEDGILEKSGDRYSFTGDAGALKPAISTEELIRRHPGCEAEIRLTERCAGQLLDVLKGDCDPLGLLFPDGEIDSLERIYKESPYARSFNSALSDAVRREVEGRTHAVGRTVSILEIGAGTGGTTAHLLPALTGQNCTYVFTDIAPLLLRRARDNFKFPFVTFEALDIEKDPDEQGFSDRRFDIVVAANVLHATKDLRETLAYVQKLLSPGGVLFLLEGTAPQRWVDLTFGLTEGWWRFEDTDLRPEYALVSRRQWETLLEDAGLTAASAVFETDSPRGVLPQALVLARKPTEISGESRSRRRWIIFGNGDMNELASRIRTAGEDVLQARALDGYEEETSGTVGIQPFDPEDFKRLLASMSRQSGHERLGIVYFSNFGEGRAAHTADKTLIPAVYLMQAMIAAASEIPSKPRLWVCTRGAQQVFPASAVIEPLQAGLWGLTRVFGLEHPEMLGGLVDLDPDRNAPDEVWSCLAANDDEDQTAIRSGHRYVLRIEHADRQAGENGSVVFRKDATYLITGGLGGLGLKVAAWMSGKGAGRLILLSRRDLPPRAEWKAITAENPEMGRVRAVQEIERSGTSVETVGVDVGDRDAMSDLFRKLKEETIFPLRGIIHAAVLMSSYPIEKLTPQAVAEMMRAKVDGALLLDELSRDMELDFFAMFSSTTSLWGAAGLAHYAAANQVLDALACCRRMEGLPAVSIDWGTWEEMRVAEARDRRFFEQAGLNPIPIGSALQVMERLLLWKEPQVCAADVDWVRLRGVYEARRKRPFFEKMTSSEPPRKSWKPDDDGGSLRQMLESTPPGNRRDMLTTHLKRRVQQVLRLDNPEMAQADQGLFEMGMDSLMAVELKSLLARDTVLPLPSTLMFNYPTINDLTSYLLEQLSERCPVAKDIAPASPQASSGMAETEEDMTEDELSDLLSRKLDELK